MTARRAGTAKLPKSRAWSVLEMSARITFSLGLTLTWSSAGDAQPGRSWWTPQWRVRWPRPGAGVQLTLGSATGTAPRPERSRRTPPRHNTTHPSAAEDMLAGSNGGSCSGFGQGRHWCVSITIMVKHVGLWWMMMCRFSPKTYRLCYLSPQRGRLCITIRC